MKKPLLFLAFSLYLFNSYAQIANPPTPLDVCDDNFDEVANFDLTIKDAEILGGQNPNDFIVTYHQTQVDAENGTNALVSPYANFVNPEVLFVRVEDIVTGNYNTTILTLRVFPLPSPGIPVPDLEECDDDNDGFASFDLTLNNTLILNGEVDVFITYYESVVDAEVGANAILDPTNYTNIAVGLQTIYGRVENIQGCYTIVDFDILANPNCNPPSELVMQNGTFNICDGLFTDSGGVSSNYANDENFTITICPDIEGNILELNFTDFASQLNVDILSIYDGDSTDANLVGTYSGLNGPELVTASDVNPSGCLTLNFISNASGNTTGWTADIICYEVCEEFTPTIEVTSHSISNSGVYTVGIGDSVALEASSSNEGVTLSYSWDFGDGNMASGASVNHQFMNEGTFDVVLNATIDGTNDCAEMDTITVVVLDENVVVYPTQYTVEELIGDIFLGGQCSQVFNIVYSTGVSFGATEPNGISYFASASDNFPISEGLVLTSGNAANAGGPNGSLLSEGSSSWPGDVDLDAAITGVQSNNATFIEFDFIPVVNEISFDFLMASEEYDGGGFECQFSDAFAFLLTDAQGNTTNLAVLPGTDTPILVTNVHPDNGSCAAANEEYFGGYIPQDSPPVAFDGMTTLLTAHSQVNIGESYHIKLVIADDRDNLYDSAVFLRGGSLDIGELCNDIGLINAKAFKDDNSNGVLDPGEQDFTQGYFTYEKNNDGIINNVNTNIGNFSIVSDNESDTYDVTFNIYDEYSNCYMPVTSMLNDISVLNGEIATINFPIENNQTCEDVAVYLVNPSDSPRPGFDYVNQLIIENLGNNTVNSGTVEVVLDGQLNFNGVLGLNSNYILTTTATGFTIDFVDLEVGVTEVVTVSLTCDVSAQLDDIVTNTATYLTDSNDLEVTNNEAILSEVVVGSYDPNDIFESHGPEIVYDEFIISDEWLYYTIRFQNLGTAEAIFVRIEDELDAQLDETTFQMLRSSHDYMVTRTGSSLEWYFEDIDLPAEQDDEEGSHGFVHFKIKPKSGYGVGDVIPNSAAIYFDFNPPVITNTFNTTFVEPLSVNEFNSSNYSIYPNPAKDEVTVKVNNVSISDIQIELIDLQGKLIRLPQLNYDNAVEFNVFALKSGVYFIKINDGSKVDVRKLVIE